MAVQLSESSIRQLKQHLETGQFANADDMILLKMLIDYEVNWRRGQNYNLTEEIPQKNKQFDTAKYINNLIGGLKKIHNQRFQYVTQNITFIKALFDLVEKIEHLMTYKEHTKYNDNAGCDGECRGLCSSCAATCTGGSSCSFGQSSGGSSMNVYTYTPGVTLARRCSTYCTSKYGCFGYSGYCVTQCIGYQDNGNIWYTNEGFDRKQSNAFELNNSSNWVVGPDNYTVKQKQEGGGYSLTVEVRRVQTCSYNAPSATCGGHSYNSSAYVGGCQYNGGCGAKNYWN